jgi:hypothetical protein
MPVQGWQVGVPEGSRVMELPGRPRPECGAALPSSTQLRCAEALPRLPHQTPRESSGHLSEEGDQALLPFGEALPIEVLGGRLLVLIHGGVGLGDLLDRLLHAAGDPGRREEFDVELADGLRGHVGMRGPEQPADRSQIGGEEGVEER